MFSFDTDHSLFTGLTQWLVHCISCRWLNQDFVTEFHVSLQPPKHMPIAYGPVKSTKKNKSKKKKNDTDERSQCPDDASLCSVCGELTKVSLIETQQFLQLDNHWCSIAFEQTVPSRYNVHIPILNCELLSHWTFDQREHNYNLQNIMT